MIPSREKVTPWKFYRFTITDLLRSFNDVLITSAKPLLISQSYLLDLISHPIYPFQVSRGPVTFHCVADLHHLTFERYP